MQDDELPEWLAEDISVQMERSAQKNKLGRGHRKRSEVKYYDDNLSENQWLHQAERGELPVQQRQASQSDEQSDDVEDEESGVIDVEGNMDGENESNTSQNKNDDESSLPPLKRSRTQGNPSPAAVTPPPSQRAPNPRKRKSTNEFTAEVEATPKARAKFTKYYKKICKLLQRAKDYSSGQEKFPSEMFVDLPDRNVYPDYYSLIKNPISLNMINEKIDNDAYAEPQDFQDDFSLMFKNAKTFNPEGPFHQYALVLESIFQYEFKSRFVDKFSKKKRHKSNSEDSSEWSAKPNQ